MANQDNRTQDQGMRKPQQEHQGGQRTQDNKSAKDRDKQGDRAGQQGSQQGRQPDQDAGSRH